MPHLTEAQLSAMLYSPQAKEAAQKFAPALDEAMDRFSIHTLHQRAMFIAQVLHESSDLRHLDENLNYSAARLKQVWPTRFADDAEAFGHQPERIANRVYANRIGNGDEASGDGWRFRGRGLIQMTGRATYERIAQETGVDVLEQPDLLLEPLPAALAAAWFWSSHGLNHLADRLENSDGDYAIVEITRRINGGVIGLEERTARYRRALSILESA